MSDPDFRALCAELVGDLEFWVDGYIATDDAGVHFVRSADAIAESRGIVSRALAALAAEPLYPNGVKP